MIKKSILTVLVILVSYHLLFPHIPRTYFQLSGHQRDNYSRAQRYVHEIPSETRVILGSSLSLRLNEGMLGPGYYKLCFGGGSIFTGLEIIRATKKHPPVVLIEVNQLGWDIDHDLLHDLLSPWRMSLRNRSPIFKEEGRPSNFVNGLAELFVRHSCEWGSRLIGQAPAPNLPEGASGLNPELFTKLIRIQREERLVVPPTNLAGRAGHLGYYVDALIREGTICIFYEMPIDSSLANLPSPLGIRQALAARFPKDRYHWIEFPRDRNYDTYDGLHVNQEEANLLTKTLVLQTDLIASPRLSVACDAVALRRRVDLARHLDGLGPWRAKADH